MEGHAVMMGGTAAGPAKPVAPVTGTTPPAPAGATEKFRVLLPIAFLDGAVHQPGEVIEISVAEAKEYAHALIRIDGQARGEEK